MGIRIITENKITISIIIKIKTSFWFTESIFYWVSAWISWTIGPQISKKAELKFYKFVAKSELGTLSVELTPKSIKFVKY
jgi:hypothetical protein